MQVTHKGRVVDPAHLSDGAIFLTDFGHGPVVRAMKAFYVPQSGIHVGKTVTVGPFRDEDQGRPGVYEPSVIRRALVVDITDALRFVYSIDPKHVIFDTPSPQESVGLAMIVEAGVFLGCRFYKGGTSWEVAYLNMATGELVFDVDAGTVCISTEWSLQELE